MQLKPLRNGARHWLLHLCIAFATIWAGAVYASPEEIVIFDDELEKPGAFGYEVHFNYASRSRREADYPGEAAPEGVLRFMPELSYGISEKWGLGLHVPMSHKGNDTTVDGFKARLTNVNKRETEWGSWFYGANYELSYFNKRLSEERVVAEVLGILGMRRGDWLFVINPVIGRTLSSNTSELDKRLDFDINFKVMKSLNEQLALGVEHYSEVGHLDRPGFGGESGQITYAIAEIKTKSDFKFNIGIGHGWSDAIDRRVFKMIVGLPF